MKLLDTEFSNRSVKISGTKPMKPPFCKSGWSILTAMKNISETASVAGFAFAPHGDPQL
jgi:hypothetical protein